jgi:hypothetical protein
LPPAVHGTQDSAKKGWGESEDSELDRRSVYLVVKRALPHPFLETFDYSNNTFPLPDRPVTTVAPQALTLLHDDFVQRQGRRMAARLMAEEMSNPGRRLDRAVEIVLQRLPDDQERDRLLDYVREQDSARPPTESPEEREAAVWTALCVALFNLNEAVYVD